MDGVSADIQRGEKRFQQNAEANKTTIAPNQRQQDKLIKFFLTKDPRTFAQPSVSVSDKDRKQIEEKLGNGELSDMSFKSALESIKPPIDPHHPENGDIAKVLDAISDKSMQNVLSLVSHGEELGRDPINSEAISRILAIYPDPIAFEKRRERIFDHIPENRRQDLEKACDDVQKILYGKKQEYWDQIKLLRQGEKNDPSEDETIAMEVISPFAQKIEEISPEDAKLFMENVEIHGDPLNGEVLTKQILEEEGMLPSHKVTIGKDIIWFSSQPYYIDKHGRVGVVAYVEHEGKKVARSFYLSNSEATWRYLPNYAKNNKGGFARYGKAFNENRINLPISFHYALDSIMRDTEIRTIKRRELVFAGTAKEGLIEGTVMHNDMQSEAQELSGNFYPAERGRLVPPEFVAFFDREQEPNYDSLLVSWESKNSLYGDITYQVFSSKDEKLQYLFCKDTAGRVWIANVEDVTSRLNPAGLREQRIEPGCLTTPAYEYVDQSHGYSGGSYPVKYPYVDMYENYISKIPMIIEYNRRFRQTEEAIAA